MSRQEKEKEWELTISSNDMDVDKSVNIISNCVLTEYGNVERPLRGTPMKTNLTKLT